MQIDLDDIVPVTDLNHKRCYKTIAFTENDRDLIETAKRVYGKEGVAEIIRRAARVGLKMALEKKPA